MTARILVADDDAGILAAVRSLLGGRGHEVVTAGSGDEALERLDDVDPDLLLSDVRMPGASGMELLEQVRARRPALPVVLMTGAGTMALAVEATQIGAADFVPKPLDPERLLAAIETALSAARASREASDLATLPLAAADDLLVGDSPAMQEVYRSIGLVAATDATVLIRGESGTGKERIARAIHRHSRRREQPLVVVNCVAIPETLLESELFGAERGAYTGAVASRSGTFERAHQGTLLLDEIGDIPLGMQGKILRVLQEKSFERIGGQRTIHSDVRILAATNRPLERAMAEGAFREDLYHRLRVVTIRMPALRERREDIPALVSAFLARIAAELHLPAPRITRDAMRLLGAHPWPGNVRELEHCLRRALIFGRGLPLQADDLRQALENQAPGHETRSRSGDERVLLDYVRAHLETRSGPGCESSLMDAVESRLVREALARAGGNQTRAAALLGIPRPTLHARLQKHGIRPSASGETPDASGAPTLEDR